MNMTVIFPLRSPWLVNVMTLELNSLPRFELILVGKLAELRVTFTSIFLVDLKLALFLGMIVCPTWTPP